MQNLSFDNTYTRLRLLILLGNKLFYHDVRIDLILISNYIPRYFSFLLNFVISNKCYFFGRKKKYIYESLWLFVVVFSEIPVLLTV